MSDESSINTNNSGPAVIADTIDRDLINETVLQNNCIIYQQNVMCKHSADGHSARLSSDAANNAIEPTFSFVRRSSWGAQPAKCKSVYLELPGQRIIIANTAHAKQENPTSHEDCMSAVRRIQNGHLAKKDYSDIGYNFLVGGDGYVYEGRGWDKQGAHTVNEERKVSYNAGSICIAFIGTFCEVAPPAKQLIAAQALINQCVQMKKLKSDYQLYGHNQLKATASPGKELYKIITTWEGWTKDIPPVVTRL